MADYGDYDSNEEEEVDYTNPSTNISITVVDIVLAATPVSNTVLSFTWIRKKQEMYTESPNNLKALLERTRLRSKVISLCLFLFRISLGFRFSSLNFLFLIFCKNTFKSCSTVYVPNLSLIPCLEVL